MKQFIGVSPRKRFGVLGWVRNMWMGNHSSNITKTQRLEEVVAERTKELKRANRKLVFQNNEKGRRAAELIIANKELAFQSGEKGKRAAELIIANTELAFQNGEKEKRAAELVIANTELVFQNGEKEKRAAELVTANTELVFQNGEKEKRAVELLNINSELEAFNFISSHDLQEPLRKILLFSQRILDTENKNLSEAGKINFDRILKAAARMRLLIDDLLSFSHLTVLERKFEQFDLNVIVAEVKNELKDTIEETQATIETTELCHASIIPFQFRQVMYNLIGNALKFSIPGNPPHIIIESTIIQASEMKDEKLSPEKEYCHIRVSDNGIGFDPEYKDRIFEVFQRLQNKDKYPGTGIGLAIVKKIIDNHHGIISASGKMNEGATFNIYIPTS